MIVGDEDIEPLVSVLPEAKRLMAAESVGSKIYLFGGISGDAYQSGIYVYDPASNSISTLDTALSCDLYGMATAAVGTKIYLFGGDTMSSGTLKRLDTISAFDTETHEISTIDTKLPNKLATHAATAGNGKIFLFGGVNNDGSSLRSIHMFNPESEAIVTFAEQLPKEIGYHTAVAVGSKAYIFGGYGDQGLLKDIYEFDMYTYSLTTLSVTLPVPTRAMAAAAVGTKIYLFGGRTADDRLTDIQVFDTENHTISKLNVDLPTKTAFAVAAASGTSIYVFGGNDGINDLTTIHKLATEFSVAENNILVEIAIMDNMVSLLQNLEVGIANMYRGNTQGVAEKVSAAVYKDGAWVEI